MADENVNIRIKINANTAEIDRVRAKLARLCAEAKACEDTFNRLGKNSDLAKESLDDLGDSARETGSDMRESRKETDATSKSIRNVGRSADGLAKILKTTYKFAFIGAGIETAALALALSSVNGLLATGKFLAKSYQVAMSAMAKAAAGAAAALATVAAAQRQYIAATGSGRYGGSFAESSRALRTMQGDARLAAVGLKGLSSAYAAASKNAKVTGVTTSGIAGLMDFAYLSGDAEKGIAAVANLISLLQSGKAAGSQDLLAAAQDIGPEFEKQYKEVIKGGKVTSDELIRMFSSGEFSKRANVAGTAANVNASLVGQLKAFMTEMQVMFGDLGMMFIKPVQEAFQEIRRIVVRTFTAISPLVADFAEGTMLDKLVNGIDKISQFTVKLMQDYVPATQNFFEKMRKAWDAIFDGFRRFGGYLQKFSAASKIMNQFLGGILKAIGGGLKTNFENFADLIVTNKEQFLEFGDSLENLITKIFDFFRALREAFMKALPYIITLVDAVSGLVKVFGDLIKTMTGFGGFGAFASLLLPFFAGGMIGKGKGRGGAMGAFGKMGPVGKMGVVGSALAGLGILQAAPQGWQQSALDIGGSAALAGAFAPGPLKVPAAIVAGGAAATGKVSDFTYQKTENRGASAAVGALGYGAAGLYAGAKIGGLIGTAIPIPGVSTLAGAAVGAIVGAIGGALYGGIKGWMNDSKYKKQAKEAAKEFVDSYTSSIDEALATNNIKEAEKLLNNFSYESSKFADQQIKEGTAKTEIDKLSTKRMKDYQSAVNLANGRLDELTSVTGKTKDEILELANAAGVNLSDNMTSLKTIMEETGIAVGLFGKDFKDAMTNVYATAVSEIQTALDILEAPKVVNELATALREKVLGGTVQGQDVASFLQAAAQEQLLASGGDPIKALAELYKNLGPGGSQYRTAGGVLANPQIEGVITGTGAGQFGQLLTAFFGSAAQGAGQVVAQNIVSQLAAVGYSPTGMTLEQMSSQLAKLPVPEILRIAESVSKANFLREETIYGPKGRVISQGQPVDEQLKGLLGPEFGSFVSSMKLQQTEEEKNRNSYALLRGSIASFPTSTKTFNDAVSSFKTTVDAFPNQLKGVLALGDTTSPRSKIVDTLGAHSAFDMQIAGNRTVTSGLRNFGLGSMSSDHASGRAYDLVGQNLGMYGQAINNAGGFAEFHGTGGQRHLHVVPPSSPIGDAATPYMGGMTSGAVSNNTTTINLTVNATPNQDVNALASEIMYRIEQETKFRNERY